MQRYLERSQRQRGMHDLLNRTIMLQRICTAAEQDERIVGLLDYGSSSEGRDDEWSDVDVALFIRDADVAAFDRTWKTWAAQFGELLLAYPGASEHPWTVYKAEPVPLRVDFAFHPASELDIMLDWPNAPTSVESMVLCDKTEGRPSDYVRQLVGRSHHPQNEVRAFEKVCGNFWYYLLYAYSKLQRGHLCFAREAYNASVLGSLMALLKLESGRVERWGSSSAAWNIENAISFERLAGLNACIPPAGEEGLRRAMYTCAIFGAEVCKAIATKRGWTWPEAVGEETIKTVEML